MKRARILVADDHSIVLAGIRSLVEQDCELVGDVGDGKALVDAALNLRPDLIILDIGMPVLNGIDAARQIRKSWPEAKFLFLTMHNNPIYLQEAMRAGGSGYVLKTSAAEELRPAIHRILKGQVYVSTAISAHATDIMQTPSGQRSRTVPHLTGRQREVIQLVAEGHTNQEISKILDLSIKTVQFHRGQIMRKLGVHTAVKLAAFAIREGLIHE